MVLGAIGNFTIGNSNNAGVASWQIDIAYVPPGSSVIASAPYQFNNDSSVPSAVVPADVRGCYRCVLKVWSVTGRSGTPSDVDIRIFGIPEPNGTVVPAPQLSPLPLRGKPDEYNLAGNANGWAGNGGEGFLNHSLRRLDTLFSGSADILGTPSLGYVVTWNGSAKEWQPSGGLSLNFSVNTGLYEVGQTISNPAFTASYNATPAAAVLTNNVNGESKDVHATPTSFTSSQTYVRNTPNQSVTWTLTTTNGTRTASATWGQKIHWGVSSAPSNTSAFGRSLAGSALGTSRNASFTVTPSGTDKIYVYLPTRYGTPTFTAGGFVGGFILLTNAISDTNAQGFTENYALYESVAQGLPQTTVATS